MWWLVLMFALKLWYLHAHSTLPMGSFISTTKSSQDHHCPTPDDVFAVRSFLLAFVPAELANLILNETCRWGPPHSVAIRVLVTPWCRLVVNLLLRLYQTSESIRRSTYLYRCTTWYRTLPYTPQFFILINYRSFRWNTSSTSFDRLHVFNDSYKLYGTTQATGSQGTRSNSWFASGTKPWHNLKHRMLQKLTHLWVCTEPLVSLDVHPVSASHVEIVVPAKNVVEDATRTKFHSTVVMNYITYYGVVSLYPSWMMSGVGTIVKKGDEKCGCIQKYRDCGYTIICHYGKRSVTPAYG